MSLISQLDALLAGSPDVSTQTVSTQAVPTEVDPLATVVTPEQMADVPQSILVIDDAVLGHVGGADVGNEANPAFVQLQVAIPPEEAYQQGGSRYRLVFEGNCTPDP